MSKRILVIDQSRTIQTLLSTYLGNAGHQIIIRSTPGEALQTLATLRDAPDLVFLAIDAKKEAYKVVEYMKVRERYSQTRLVALVREEEQASIERRLNGTHVSFLVKPFHIQDALSLVSAGGPGAIATYETPIGRRGVKRMRRRLKETAADGTKREREGQT